MGGGVEGLDEVGFGVGVHMGGRLVDVGWCVVD
jgi:hypothetical protein